MSVKVHKPVKLVTVFMERSYFACPPSCTSYFALVLFRQIPLSGQWIHSGFTISVQATVWLKLNFLFYYPTWQSQHKKRCKQPFFLTPPPPVCTYLNILNKLLSWSINWRFCVNHILDGTWPAGRLIKQFCIETVTMLASVYSYIPIT